MAFDPFLYLAFVAGVVAGRLIGRRFRWVPPLTLATVVLLVGLLGASLDSVPTPALVSTIPIALGFAAAILALTAVVYLLTSGRSNREEANAPPAPRGERFPLSALLLASLLVGFGVGRVVSVPAAAGLTYSLYALLALVGFDLRLTWDALRGIGRPLASATLAAVGAAVAFAAVSGTSLSVSLATTLAFGWYTLAGPLVAAKAGAIFGLLAFLTNFLRENLTMLLAPQVGRRLRGGGLAAMGGATAMDTTLYFVTRYGDPEAGSLALATGLILTVAAGLLLPAVLALPF